MTRACKMLMAVMMGVVLGQPAFAQNGAASQIGNNTFDSLNRALRVDAVATGGGGNSSAPFLNLDQLLSSVYDSTNNALKVNIVSGLPCAANASGAVTCAATGTNQDVTLTPSGTGATTAANFQDRGGQVFNVKAYGAVGDGVTDDTAAVQAAISAAYAGVGGTIYFPAGTYLLSTALTIPNDGAAVPKQKALRLTGSLIDVNAASWGASPASGTLLNFTQTTNTVADIDTRGAGYLEIDHLGLEDTANDSIPFIHTTNTTLHVHDCSFTSSQSGTANTKDAIILGGASITKDGSENSPFQGYGTVIRDNFFNRVRHAVVGNTWANNVQIVDNTVGSGSGSSTAGDAPIVFVGYGTGSNDDSGGFIAGNLIEEHNYYYGIRLSQYAESFTLLGNGGYDSGANTVANIYLGTGSETQTISCGQLAVSPYCVDPNSPGYLGHDVTILSPTQETFGNNPSFPKGVTIPAGGCLAFDTTSNVCMYLSGTTLAFRPQNNSALKTTFNSLGYWGILNSQPRTPLDVTGAIRTEPVAFASAQGCSGTIEGATQAISDSTTATWGAAITGGGSNHVLGYCDGTNWTVAAK